MDYPIYLAAGPIVSALTAGNRILVDNRKPRRERANCSPLVARHFDPALLVVNGPTSLANSCRCPDHLLFTGSTAVGRDVMRAAAESTPVTLELGGKSHIVGRGIDTPRPPASHVRQCLNAGQTCVAPDYRWFPRAHRGFRTRRARAGADVPAPCEECPVLVDRERASRCLRGLLPRPPGTRIEERIPAAATCRARPRSRRNCSCLRIGAARHEEIFGPLLPIVGYRDAADAIARERAPAPARLVCDRASKRSPRARRDSLRRRHGERRSRTSRRTTFLRRRRSQRHGRIPRARRVRDILRARPCSASRALPASALQATVRPSLRAADAVAVALRCGCEGAIILESPARRRSRLRAGSIALFQRRRQPIGFDARGVKRGRVGSGRWRALPAD